MFKTNDDKNMQQYVRACKDEMMKGTKKKPTTTTSVTGIKKGLILSSKDDAKHFQNMKKKGKSKGLLRMLDPEGMSLVIGGRRVVGVVGGRRRA